MPSTTQYLTILHYTTLYTIVHGRESSKAGSTGRRHLSRKLPVALPCPAPQPLLLTLHTHCSLLLTRHVSPCVTYLSDNTTMCYLSHSPYQVFLHITFSVLAIILFIMHTFCLPCSDGIFAPILPKYTQIKRTLLEHWTKFWISLIMWKPPGTLADNAAPLSLQLASPII